MAKLSKHKIREVALQTIKASSGGIRYTDLVNHILREHPETPRNTICGSVWDLATQFPNEVVKPSRGLFMSTSAEDAPPTVIAEARLPEKDLYEPFADWLKNDLDEVTTVAPLGGAGLKGKWGTPDVVGVYKPLASNLIRFPLEIVSAEIKLDPQAPVVAFGQAVAYRLFSTKCYVVMPDSISQEDMSRLEALSILFGLGLVIYEVDGSSPSFVIRVRAQRFAPDMFYVNEFADRLRKHDPTMFERLFS